MILVTGATGNVGSALVDALLARGQDVRAVTRAPEHATLPDGVERVHGDLAAPETVTRALASVSGLFLLGSFGSTSKIVRAAQDAGVEHVVLLTSRCVIGGAADNAITRMWLDAEEALQRSALAWTILRPSGFQSNALRWVPQLRRGNVVRAPWPNTAIASIHPADIADVAATALTMGGYEHAALELSGPQALTPADQVRILGETLGRSLQYEPLNDDEARLAMAADTPPDFIDAFFRFFSEGEFNDARLVNTVQMTTGRDPREFSAWAREHATAFAQADVLPTRRAQLSESS